jgi:two-component system sensor histidine kinase VicK
MPASLKLNDRQLLEILSMSKDATAIYATTDLYIQFANDAMLAFWGKSSEIVGLTLEEAVPELREQPFKEMLQEVLYSGITKSGEAVAAETQIAGSLQINYYDYEYRAIKDSTGKTYAILHTATNVTAKVLANEAIQKVSLQQEALEREQYLNEELATTNEELNATNDELTKLQHALTLMNTELEERVASRTSELLESEARFRSMAEGAGVPIAVSDESRNAVYFNNAWLRLTGKNMRELLGFGWVDLIHPEDKQNYLDAYLGAFKNKLPFKSELRIRSKHDEYRWLMINGSPRFLPNNGFAGYISSCMDISSLKEAEQRKDDFISIASHELKTPLTSLKASLQLMDRVKEQAQSPMIQKFIEQSNKSMDKITALVEDLLNASRTTEGQLHLNKIVFDICRLLNECCNNIRLGGIYELVVHCEENLMVYADEHRIDQVLVNLANNAIKYAPESKQIFIKAERQDGKVRVSVKDKGPGIPADQIPHLFDRYYRATYSGAGLGLGLYICSEIIKRHEGEIGVESEVGQGSTFWFTLPLAK